MRDERELDERLSLMLGAASADADPALMTRVRARIAARERVPRLLRWTMRPAALGASLALLVACAGLSLLLVASAPMTVTAEDESLIDALLAERGGEEGASLVAPAPEAVSPGDSGDAR